MSSPISNGKRQSEPWKPMLAPKPLMEFSAAEWQAYVKSLHRAPEAAKVARAWSFRHNDKGTPILTIRGTKDPKFLFDDELPDLMLEMKTSRNDMLNFLFKKKVEVRKRVK